MWTVTITGADDDVDPSALEDLSDEFPFVEWGILRSAKREGPDYMRMKWMKDGRILPRRTNTPAEVARGGRLLIFWALRRMA